MSKIKISLELDDSSVAIDILKYIQHHQYSSVSDSSATFPLNEEVAKKSPPPTPKKKEVAKKSPPPTPKKKEETNSQKYDTARADISNELTRIMNNNGKPRKLLNDSGYSTVAEIPETRLISFLEMVKGQ